MKKVFLILNVLLVITICSAQTKNLISDNSTVKTTAANPKNKIVSDGDSGKKELMKVRKREEIPSPIGLNTSATAPSNSRKVSSDPNLNPNISTKNPSKTANPTSEDNDGNGATGSGTTTGSTPRP